MSPNSLGALLMMAAMASFTVNDTFVKLTGGAIPLWQLLFLRGVMTTALIVAMGFALRSISFQIARGDWGWIGLRSASEVGAAYFFITALLSLPIANVTAILQILPLTVTLGAALFFREPLGWRRMTAIAIGFVGMLLIVRPGADGFNLMSLYVIAAVLCVTVRDLSTRNLSPGVPSMTVTLSAAVFVTVFAGVASVPQGWVELTPRLWGLITAASVFIIGGYFFSVQVMRTGEIGFIAPFRYTALVWALLLGWFVFGDWPDRMTILGACIIVATGLFTLWRERKVSGR